jgi:hypothetical protein
MLSAASPVPTSSKLTQRNSLSLATRRINCVQCSLLEAHVSNYRNALWKCFTLTFASSAIFHRLRTRNSMTPQLPQKTPQHTRTTNQTVLKFSCCAQYQHGLLLEFTHDSRAYRSLVNAGILPIFPAFTKRISKCLRGTASWLSCINCNRCTKAWVVTLFVGKRVGGFFNSKCSLHDWRYLYASTSNTSTIKGQLMYYVRICPHIITPYPKYKKLKALNELFLHQLRV